MGEPKRNPPNFARPDAHLPLVEVPPETGYDRVFRVTVVSFLDRFNFCLAGVKRSCIHFVTDDGRIIPFDTCNMFHRPGLPARVERAG
jgi:hypothetical protein